MRNILFVTILISLFIISCNKDNTTPSNSTTSKSQYYFKFNFEGQNYNFDADNPQYMSLSTSEFGGFQTDGASLASSSAGISFFWQNKDTITETDVMSLVGKTIYFDDTTIRAELYFNNNANGDYWYTVDTSDRNFSITVNSITYLKKDTTYFAPVNVYVLKGTCNGLMYLNSNYTRQEVLSNGEFNFLVSDRDDY